MPTGRTMLKLRRALEEIYDARRRAEEGEKEAQELLERLSRPGGLHELAASRADLEDHEIEYLAAYPPRLLESVRAVLADVANSDEQPLVEIQFLPGYEFEVRFIEYGDQLTIHLRGPFAAPFPRDSYVVPGKAR